MNVFLSYPKSGRTWVRFMVDSYLCRHHGIEVAQVFEAEQRLQGTPDHVAWTHLTGAMIGQLPYWQMGGFKIGDATRMHWVLLVRPAHATLRSAFFQARDRIKVFAGSPAEFVRDPRYGAAKLATFYNLWTEHLRDRVAGHTLFAYDEMLVDPVGELTRMLKAMAIPVRDDWVREVVAEASPQRMRSLGLTPAYAGTPLAPSDPSRPETYKVRNGVGNTDLFAAEDLAYIDRVLDALLIAPDDPACQALRRTTPVRAAIPA